MMEDLTYDEVLGLAKKIKISNLALSFLFSKFILDP